MLSHRLRLIAAVAGVAGLSVLAGCGSTAAGLASRSAAGQEAWVANHAFESEPGSTITPVDLADRRAGPEVTTAAEPAAFAVVPSGNQLLVANRGKDTLSVVDTANGEVTGTVKVGMEPDAVAWAPGGTDGHGLALVANFGDDSVTPVDLGTMRAGPPIPVGSEPDALAVSNALAGAVGEAEGGRSATAVVADFAAGTVTPIDLATMKPGPAIKVGSEPDAVGIVPQGPTGPEVALVSDFGSDELTPIDLATMAAGAQVPLGANPTGMVVAPDGTAWIVAGAAVIPVAPAHTVLTPGSSIALPDVGEAVALEASGTAWVAEQDGSIVPVSLPSGPVGKPVHVGGHPSAIVIPSA